MNFVPITSNNIDSQGIVSSDYRDGFVGVKDDLFATDLSNKYVKTENNDSLHQLNDVIKFNKIKHVKSGNKKSFVWKYFRHPKIDNEIEDRTRTECLECKSQLAFNASGTTTTMLNHLKSRHPKIAECEEWKKVKLDSSNLLNGDVSFSVSKTSESPTETLSPSGSFDFHKPVSSSPDYKNSKVCTMSINHNSTRIFNNYMDSGRLMCPQPLTVTSSLQTTNHDSNCNSSTINNHIAIIHNKGNGLYNGSSFLDTNNNCSYDNRSAVKRKRKKPNCKQNSINNSNELISYKLEKIAKTDSYDLHSIQSMASISRNKNLCNNFLNNGTSPSLYNDNNNNISYLPLQSISSRVRSPLSSTFDIRESDKIIVYWLIKDLRPYSVLEETGMKTLFSVLMPSITVPDVATIKNQIIPSIYDTFKSDILNDVSLESGTAFSIELWDNPSNDNIYTSLRLNFYSNKNHQLQSKMMVTKEINAKHLCSDILLNCCNEIGIDFSKVHFIPIVMNNPESMSDELANVGEIEQNKKFIVIPCLMNSLQEVTELGFQEPEVVNLLEKCRVLKELAGAYNLQFNNFPSVNCAFLSLNYVSEKFELIYWIYRNLDQIIDKLDCFNTERFTKDDEIFLRQLTPLLEHIYQTLNVIEQNKLFFSASMIKSIILTMNKSPFQPKDDDHPGVIQFKIAVKNRLSIIYPTSGPLHDILSIATILDPRFKKYNDSHESVIMQELRNEITNNSAFSTSSVFLHESSMKRENFHTIFGDDCLSQEPKPEVDQYLSEPKIDIEKNPIKWWHDNATRFPNLSKTALKYLCIPLANQHSLTSSECNSVAYSRRKDIDPDEIDHYLFLNHNWR